MRTVKLVRDPQPLIITLACPRCGGRIELDRELGYVCLDQCDTFGINRPVPVTKALLKHMTQNSSR